MSEQFGPEKYEQNVGFPDQAKAEAERTKKILGAKANLKAFSEELEAIPTEATVKVSDVYKMIDEANVKIKNVIDVINSLAPGDGDINQYGEAIEKIKGQLKTLLGQTEVMHDLPAGEKENFALSVIAKRLKSIPKAEAWPKDGDGQDDRKMAA